MPSVMIGAQSGGVPLWSGCLFSGVLQQNPIGGIVLRSASTSSGSCFFGFSGGVTMYSGGGQMSGGLNDGFEIGRGEYTFVPKSLLVNQYLSGATLWATCPAAGSGFVRLCILPDMNNAGVRG